MKINMIGLGYIGLPTAALMSTKGAMSVVGVDISQYVCDTVNRGDIHIVEERLESLVKRAVESKSLTASTKPTEADAYVIAVPTPFKEDKTPDLKYVEQACKDIAPFLTKGSLVILESTSPVGATEQVVSWLQNIREDLTFPSDSSDSTPDVYVAYCPERVLPGNVIEELQKNDRVIGGMSSACSEKAKNFYERFVDGECIVTNSKTAEMAKLTENSFRDVNIAFANELSMICGDLGIDVWELIALTNRHPRVNVLQPGCGVGGHCIAVDPWFIVNSAPEKAKIIKQARLTNDHKPLWVAAEVLKVYSELLSDSQVNVTCYGLSFKPNIDDFRESPAVSVVKEIARIMPNAKIQVVEPFIGHEKPKELDGIDNVSIIDYDKKLVSDIKVMLVAHDVFKSDYEDIKQSGEVINFAWRS